MSLQLIVGCMFSGKSTELIRRIRRFQSIGKRVMVVNHTLDNRDGSSNAATHYGDNVAIYFVAKLLVLNFLTYKIFTQIFVIILICNSRNHLNRTHVNVAIHQVITEFNTCMICKK